MTDPVRGNGQGDGLPPRGIGRRRSLIFLLGLLFGLPLAFVIRSAVDEGWRPVTTVEELEANDVIYVSPAQVFLVHGDPPHALSAESPHLGEILAYCESGQNFVSPGHGEQFDRSGGYLEGPAPHGMDRIAVRVRDGNIEINVADRTLGPPVEERRVPTRTPCAADNLVHIRPGFVEQRLPA